MRRGRVLGDALMTAGGALALVLALVMLDDRVRDQINSVFDARHPAASLSGLGSRAGEIASIVAMAMREQSLEHAPLVIFAVAATVLVVFMLRT